MISVNAVDEHIRRVTLFDGTEVLSLDQSAGRCLRQNLVAKRPAPPFDRVMMDGFAICASSVQRGIRTFQVESNKAPAGTKPPALRHADKAIEVMTGAMLPLGTDCIVPVESCEAHGDTIVLNLDSMVKPGQYIHSCGFEYTSGEMILASGVRMHPAQIALAASEGYDQIEVNSDLCVHLITTGDEIVPPGSKPQPWQIFGTHTAAINAALARVPDIRFRSTHVGDTLTSLVGAIESSVREADMIILCGAMSKGKKDFGINAMQQCGFDIVFHRVAQRPGHPMALAVRGKTLLFGLPGNPLAVLFTFYRYVLTALDRLRGCPAIEPVMVKVSGELPALRDETRYVPCRIQNGQTLLVMPYNSGDLLCLANSDGFVEIPPGNAVSIPSGFAYFWPWH